MSMDQIQTILNGHQLVGSSIAWIVWSAPGRCVATLQAEAAFEVGGNMSRSAAVIATQSADNSIYCSPAMVTLVMLCCPYPTLRLLTGLCFHQRKTNANRNDTRTHAR